MGLTMAEAYPNDGPSWFALTVKPQHERAVREQLEAYSLEAYVPLYRSRRRWSDRLKTIQVPLFRQYVFSRFPVERRLTVIALPSVSSIVSFGGVPCPINQREIDTLKLLTSQDYPLMPWPFIRTGQRVRVRQGPLFGLEGILVREKAAYRVVVSVQMLERSVAVELERDVLEPVHSSRLSGSISCAQ
jgi:transcription antitermination factor NusG